MLKKQTIFSRQFLTYRYIFRFKHLNLNKTMLRTVSATSATISPILAASAVCGLLNCNSWSELGFNPPVMCFTILTPCLSALVKKTSNVDIITDSSGAIAANQNSFLYFLA